MTRSKLTFAAIIAAGLGLTAAAQARWVDAGDVDVGFLARGPAGMKINGSAPELKAQEKDGKLTVTVPLGNLETGMKLRNKHLRGYLETDKYPDATLSVKRAKLKEPANDETVSSSATGEFTLHGVTKSVKFNYRVKRTGSDYHVQGLASVDIRDFNVEVPCYLGVCVDPTVKLKVKFKLRDVE